MDEFGFHAHNCQCIKSGVRLAHFILIATVVVARMNYRQIQNVMIVNNYCFYRL